MSRSRVARFVPQTCLILALSLGSVGPGLAAEGSIYWTFCFEGCSLRKIDLDGSNDQNVLTEDTGSSFDLHLGAGKVYFPGGFWSNPGTMRRANMDGSGAETLLASIGYVSAVAVDPLGGKFYFGQSTGSSGEILRANLDGSNQETILSVQVGDIDVDSFAAKLYFVTDDEIQRSNLDGSNVETVVGPGDVTPLEPVGIAVDSAGKKLYWTDRTNGARRILRVDLDGSNVETLVTEADVVGSFYPLRIALDRPAGKMYWTDYNAIRRANTDGSRIQAVIDWGEPDPLGGPFDIAIDVPGNEVPATSVWAVVMLTLLLTGAATVILLRRRSRSAN